MRSLSHAVFAAAALLAGTAAAHASIYNGQYAVTVTEGFTNGSGFSTTAGVPSLFGGSASDISANFTYTGALNFNNTASQNALSSGDLNSTFGFTSSNITGYANTSSNIFEDPLNAGSLGNFGSYPLVANFQTLAGFLGSSGSAAGYAYGSYYTFDLGTIAAGTKLTITHDDGISLFDAGIQLAGATDGPTTQVTDTVTVGSTGDVILRYSRQNGTPSVLQVSVPEPASLALLGAGLMGFVAIRRRRAPRA